MILNDYSWRGLAADSKRVMDGVPTKGKRPARKRARGK
jgi:hypothetical protein